MNTKYIDFIDHTFNFPQEEFSLEGENLKFHNIDLMELIQEYGAPLKFTYLPKISQNIRRAKLGLRMQSVTTTIKANINTATAQRALTSNM